MLRKREWEQQVMEIMDIGQVELLNLLTQR